MHLIGNYLQQPHFLKHLLIFVYLHAFFENIQVASSGCFDCKYRSNFDDFMTSLDEPSQHSTKRP